MLLHKKKDDSTLNAFLLLAQHAVPSSTHGLGCVSGVPKQAKCMSIPESIEENCLFKYFLAFLSCNNRQTV